MAPDLGAVHADGAHDAVGDVQGYPVGGEDAKYGPRREAAFPSQLLPGEVAVALPPRELLLKGLGPKEPGPLGSGAVVARQVLELAPSAVGTCDAHPIDHPDGEGPEVVLL